MKKYLILVLVLGIAFSANSEPKDLSGVWWAKSKKMPDIAMIVLSSSKYSKGKYTMQAWMPYVREDPQSGKTLLRLRSIGRTTLKIDSGNKKKDMAGSYCGTIKARKRFKKPRRGRPIAISYSNYSKRFCLKMQGPLLSVQVDYICGGCEKHNRKALTKFKKVDPLAFRINNRRIVFMSSKGISFHKDAPLNRLVRYAYLSKTTDFKIQGEKLFFSKGEMVSFHKNGSLSMGTLSSISKLRVGGKSIKFKGQISFHEDGKIKWGWLAEKVDLNFKGKKRTVPGGNIVILNKKGRLTYYGDRHPGTYDNGL